MARSSSSARRRRAGRQPAWPDGRHHTEPDRHLVEQAKILGDAFSGVGLLQNLFQMRLHAAAELGEADCACAAVEQRATELGLQLLDRCGERRLRDVTVLGSTSETQRLRRRKKISHLMHFHRRHPLAIGARACFAIYFCVLTGTAYGCRSDIL
jgi:hypothetical protein